VVPDLKNKSNIELPAAFLTAGPSAEESYMNSLHLMDSNFFLISRI
jgi:hypothetical protein